MQSLFGFFGKFPFVCVRVADSDPGVTLNRNVSWQLKLGSNICMFELDDTCTHREMETVVNRDGSIIIEYAQKIFPLSWLNAIFCRNNGI